MADRRVILLIEAASAYGRGCLRGVARYARLHGQWTFWHGTRYLTDRLDLPQIREWGGDGVICRIENEQMLKSVRSLNLPTVDIRGGVKVEDIPSITTDPVGVVRMAMEHLLSKGYEHIAFCGYRGLNFSESREQAFGELKHLVHGSHHVYQPGGRKRKQLISEAEQYRSPDQKAVENWLRRLPKPVGVVTCNDQRGKQVLQACTTVGLRVPYDVGVVGVDNDEVICALANPPLTSVVPHVEAVGHDAARLLDEMMNGRMPAKMEYLISPKSVRLRTSTDTTAVQDKDLSAAIHYIDDHIDQGINVSDVVNHTPLSRSSLERRFEEHLGCTPHEFILRRRLDRIRQLLAETNLTAGDVAARCGFKTASHMIALFRTQTGQTPNEYRRGIQ